MSSINTNASAMTALQTLNSISKSMSTTQERISTGLRVNSASDNAAYWSISTTMKSDSGALSAVQDNLGLGASKIDTAYTGMNKVIDAANQIKSKLVSAVGASDSDKEKIQTEIKALQDQMQGYADASTFSGSNMLSVDTTNATTAGTADDIQLVSSYNRDTTGAVTIGTIDIDAESIKLYDAAATDETNQGILETTRDNTGARATAQAATLGDAAAAGDTYAVSTLSISTSGTAASDSQIQDMIGAVEGALKDMTTAATKLGAAKNSVSLQQDFNSQLMDSIDRGVGQLVDADMNQESARLSALQVQQQLGIQALSIANSNSQNILSLFR